MNPSLNQVGSMAELKGSFDEAIEHYSRALEIAKRYGIQAFGARVKSGLGATFVAIGRISDGVELLREGYSGWSMSGGQFYRTILAAEAADALLKAGRREEALGYLSDGEHVQQETDERFQAAQLLRLRGQLAEHEGDHVAAESAYRRSIAIAEQQGATFYALRGAVALARLGMADGRAVDAQSVLQPIVDQFTEGFDWPDLVNARSVLDGHN